MTALILSSMKGQEITALLRCGEGLTGTCKEIWANSVVITGADGWVWRVDPAEIVAICVKEADA